MRHYNRHLPRPATMELLSESISYATLPVAGHRPTGAAARTHRKSMRRKPVKLFGTTTS
jgi:hypothetical protein